MTCTECQLLEESKEQCWLAYEHQKRINKSRLFNDVKSTEETDHLLEEYKISSARLRYHLAIKHTDQGHRVSENDLHLLSDEDGPISC